MFSTILRLILTFLSSDLTAAGPRTVKEAHKQVLPTRSPQVFLQHQDSEKMVKYRQHIMREHMCQGATQPQRYHIIIMPTQMRMPTTTIMVGTLPVIDTNYLLKRCRLPVIFVAVRGSDKQTTFLSVLGHPTFCLIQWRNKIPTVAKLLFTLPSNMKVMKQSNMLFKYPDSIRNYP